MRAIEDVHRVVTRWRRASLGLRIPCWVSSLRSGGSCNRLQGGLARYTVQHRWSRQRSTDYHRNSKMVGDAALAIDTVMEVDPSNGYRLCGVVLDVGRILLLFRQRENALSAKRAEL